MKCFLCDSKLEIGQYTHSQVLCCVCPSCAQYYISKTLRDEIKNNHNIKDKLQEAGEINKTTPNKFLWTLNTDPYDHKKKFPDLIIKIIEN